MSISALVAVEADENDTAPLVPIMVEKFFSNCFTKIELMNLPFLRLF